MNQNEVTVFGATQLVVGLSQVVRWIPAAYTIDGSIKILSGQTLEIV